MTIHIQHNVPPPQIRARASEARTTLLAMKPGDSILIETTTKTTWVQAAWRMQIKITTRRDVDGKHRVWRVE